MDQPVIDILHIRLNTGEDLIAEVHFPEIKKGHEHHIILYSPMKIICLPSGKPGFISLSLMQWIFTKITSEQKFNIFSRDILTMSKPNISLVEYYKETVDYFDSKNSKSVVYEDLEELENEINAVNKSDKMVIEDNEDNDVLKDAISELLKSYSSNNKGTLH